MKKILLIAVLFSTICLSASLFAASSSYSRFSEKDIEVGLTPGFSVTQTTPNVAMDIGGIFNYFMWDNISLGFRFDAITSFKNSIFVFMPKAGYYHEIDDDFSAYINGGFGISYITNPKKAYATIGIPGVGVTYSITDHLSISLDTNLNTAIGKNASALIWSAGPLLKWKF